MAKKKNVLITGGLLLCLLIIYVCNVHGENSSKNLIDNRPMDPSVAAVYMREVTPLSEDEASLFEDTILEVLKQDLWTSRDLYDSTTFLLVPMHYAFYSSYDAGICAFADFFARFTQDVAREDQYNFQEAAWSNKLQFLYLASQYMALCAGTDRAELIPEGLPSMV